MTEPTPPLDIDSLVNALVEGTGSPGERERMANDPALRARVEHTRVLRAQLAEPPPELDPAIVDRMISTALSATDAGAEPTRAPPTRWLVAAALVLIVALGAVTVPRLVANRTSSDTASSVASTTGTDAASAPSGANAGTESGPTAEQLEATAPVADTTMAFLGEAPSDDVLLDRTRALLTDPPAFSDRATAAAGASVAPTDERCRSVVPTGAIITSIGSGSVRGEERIIFVTATAGETETIWIIEPTACTVTRQTFR